MVVAGIELDLPRTGEVARALQAVGPALEEDGADVICLGSTTMHKAHEYLKDRLEVPLIDPGPLTYRIVQALFGLGLSHSRQAYRGPVTRVDDMIVSMVANGAAVVTES